MKIKIRLTLIFTLIFGLILFLFIGGVYQFYSKKIHSDYFERLHLLAALKVDLIDGEAVDPQIFHILYENASSKYEPHVSIYSENGKLIYHDKENAFSTSETKRILNIIHQKGECRIWHNDLQTYGFLVEGNKGDYAVYASGYDYVGINQLEILKKTLAVAYLLAMLCIVLVIWLIIRQTLHPISLMREKVEDIYNTNQLNIRLYEGNKRDELAQLAITFNKMLSNLETSFESQKQFVYNISHELRTPLSAIITELELAKLSGIEKTDCTSTINNVLNDAHRLSRLSTNLLDLARANYNPTEIGMSDVRIDELLIEVCANVQNAVQDYNIEMSFETNTLDDERYIAVHGNVYLLGVAFSNLLNNACKYSNDKSCSVVISYNEKTINVSVSDNGIGIPADEFEKIFEPFYRGANGSFAEGNGIGLSLTKKIIELHNGTISLKSKPGSTTFTVELTNVFHT